jgi:sec-independent protein translocase protein TatA
MIGTTEILIIGGVIVLLFGAAAIPKFTRAIGKAKGEFEKGVQDSKSLATPTENGENEKEKK